MLQSLDLLFTLLHLVIILFNLFGWLLPHLLKAHLIFALLTLASWLVLGIWFGIGYCPITDWQWQIKEKLGEHNLPASFVKYFADAVTGYSFDPALIDVLTGLSFGIAIFASVYLNIIRFRRNKRLKNA